MEQNCTFFKKSGQKRRGQRQRGDHDSDHEQDEKGVVKKVEKRKAKNPFVQSSGSATKKREEEHHSDSDKDEDSGVTADKTVTLSYKSSRTGKREGPDDMGATLTVEIDTELDRDAQAIFQRQLDTNKEQKGKADDKIYRGQTAYTQYVEKKDTAAGNAASGLVRQGPIRAPAHLRATVRWDYQPDTCKDYKETGFCGFGDSCKFMHDRGDYKHGWQLEREADKGEYGKEDPHAFEVDSDDDDGLPFACFICRDGFKHPVVTKCKHYFCEQCALNHYKKTSRCYVCSEQTYGVFNPAKDIIKKMKSAAPEES